MRLSTLMIIGLVMIGLSMGSAPEARAGSFNDFMRKAGFAWSDGYHAQLDNPAPCPSCLPPGAAPHGHSQGAVRHGRFEPVTHGPVAHGPVAHGPVAHRPTNHGPVAHRPTNHGPTTYGHRFSLRGPLNYGHTMHRPALHGRTLHSMPAPFMYQPWVSPSPYATPYVDSEYDSVYEAAPQMMPLPRLTPGAPDREDEEVIPSPDPVPPTAARFRPRR
jgi:hypothetical protein